MSQPVFFDLDDRHKKLNERDPHPGWERLFRN